MKSAVRHNQYCHREGRHEIWLSDAISTATARVDTRSAVRHNQYRHREGRHEIWLSDAISDAIVLHTASYKSQQ